MVKDTTVTWSCRSVAPSSTIDFTSLKNVAWLVGPENTQTVMSTFIQQDSNLIADWDYVRSILPEGLACIGILIPASAERHSLEEAKGLIENICFEGNEYAQILGDEFTVVLWANEKEKSAFSVNGSNKNIQQLQLAEDSVENSKTWLRAVYSDKIVVPLPPVSTNSPKALSDIVSLEVKAVLEKIERPLVLCADARL